MIFTGTGHNESILDGRKTKNKQFRRMSKEEIANSILHSHKSTDFRENLCADARHNESDRMERDY